MHDQAKSLKDWLVSLRTPVAVVDGNHDFWTARGSIDLYADSGWLKMLRQKGNIIGIPGEVIEFKGLRVACNGWLQLPRLDGPIDILVTHAPPAGCMCSMNTNGNDHGDIELSRALRTPHLPRWLLAGHVHEPKKLWCRWPKSYQVTTVLNPGFSDGSQVPAHWIIDTERHSATHSSGEYVK